MNKKRLLVMSSPSGGGKSTISKALLETFGNLKLSVSATTRDKRPGEEHGVQYYFLSRNEFVSRIQNNDFVEYEEIFGNYYGSPKTEINNAINNEICLLFDIDVKGALAIKKAFPNDSLLLFITPPDLSTLEYRLRSRNTETEEQIITRLSRAEMELSFINEFEFVVVNDILTDAVLKTLDIVRTNMMVKEA